MAKVITGVKFKDAIEVTAVDQAAAGFILLNTTFDHNSKYEEVHLKAYESVSQARSLLARYLDDSGVNFCPSMRPSETLFSGLS